MDFLTVKPSPWSNMFHGTQCEEVPLSSENWTLSLMDEAWGWFRGRRTMSTQNTISAYQKYIKTLSIAIVEHITLYCRLAGWSVCYNRADLIFTNVGQTRWYPCASFEMAIVDNESIPTFVGNSGFVHADPWRVLVIPTQWWLNPACQPRSCWLIYPDSEKVLVPKLPK